MAEALPKLIKKYKLTNKSKVLDLGCKKGLFIKRFKYSLPGIKSYGVENHPYPLKNQLNVIANL